MQYCLTGFGAVAFVLIYFFLPETWHGETPHAKECRERGKKFIIHKFNPLSSVALLRWPNVACSVSLFDRSDMETEVLRATSDSRSVRPPS